MRRAYLLSLLLLPIACTAENYALTKANNDFNRSLVAFNEKDSECRASAAALPSDTLLGIKATAEEKKTALQYHYFQSLSECTSEATKDYLLSSSVLAALAEKERAASIHESSRLIIDTNLRLLKAEAQYKQLSDALRAELDKIPALKEPFTLIESVKALGIE